MTNHYSCEKNLKSMNKIRPIIGTYIVKTTTQNYGLLLHSLEQLVHQII